MENKEMWFQKDAEINKKERENVETRNKKEIEKLDFAEGTPLQERFKRFTEGNTKEEVETKEELSPEAKELVSLRWKNLVSSFRSYKEKEDNIILDEILLQQAINEIRKKDKRAISTRNEFTDAVIDEIESLKKKQEDLKQESPEAYIGLNLREFKEQIARTKEGGMVETNYVKNKKKEVSRKMRENNHIFLHGHLGGGKTDFAIDVSIERMIDLNVQREVDQWMSENLEAEEKEVLLYYKEIKSKYHEGLKNNNLEVMEKVRPYLIAGSKDFSLQDLYTEKTLKVTKFNGKSLSEHIASINQEFDEWKAKNSEELFKMEKDERIEREQQEHLKLLELYKMKNTGFGTEVDKIDKELKKAIKEGKPIIIDEANAIPPTLLISMNDVLTSKPGELVYIPGEGSVEVKEGFNIIMTGNLESSNLTEYFGTQEMNPAFLSRLKTMEYNYLPQNENGNLHEQSHPEKNELFQVVTAFLANKDGSLTLPEGSLDKIFRLCQLSKVTQDVFSGRWKESEYNQDASGDTTIEPKLEKSVLSIRNIINVLKEWNKGQEKDLDMALWKAFISEATIPSDQNFILNEAKSRFGFFKEADGWNINFTDKQNSLIKEEDILKDDYDYKRINNHNYSPRDVIEIIYGKAPERVKFPDVSVEAFSEEEIDLEKISEIEDFEKELNKYERAYQVALGKECPSF
jgi:hypothetical protein